jgi:hypothetical protein
MVGTRTRGGVRGVDFKYELGDNRAARLAAGRDPQLDTAVRLALQALDERGPAGSPTI